MDAGAGAHSLAWPAGGVYGSRPPPPPPPPPHFSRRPLAPLRPRGLRALCTWPAAKAADCQFSFFPFCFTARGPGDFHPGTFQSRDAWPARGARGRCAACRQGARRAREGDARPAASPRPAPPRFAPPRLLPEKLLRFAPGCPRVSHLGISEAGANVTSMWKSR
nr:forkhead box protein D1-like [Manis javanica]